MKYYSFFVMLGSIFLSPQVGFSLLSPDAAHFKPVISESIQVYERQAEEKIDKIIAQILSLPKYERTFENTLELWERCMEQLSYEYQTLAASDPKEEFVENRSNLNPWIVKKLYENQELDETLAQIAWTTMNDENANRFQRHLSRSFLRNHEHIGAKSQIVHAHGVCAQKSRENDGGFTILNLPLGGLSERETPLLAESIRTANADIVCVQKITNIKTSYTLLKALRNDYAHFYFSINTCGREFANGNPLIGTNMLIASKYPLGNVVFHDLRDDTLYEDENLLDFFVLDEEKPFGRVYVGQIRDDKPDYAKISHLTKIMEHILLAHVIAPHKKEIPVLLCSNFGLQENFHVPISTFMNPYFSILDGSRDSDLFSQYLTSLDVPNAQKRHEYVVKTSPATLSQNHKGLLSSIQESDSKLLIKSFEDTHLSENSTTNTDVSFHADNNGATVDASVSTSTETESGNTVTVETSATVSRDSNGNTSGEVEFGVSYSW